MQENTYRKLRPITISCGDSPCLLIFVTETGRKRDRPVFCGVCLTIRKIEKCLEQAVQLNVLKRLGSEVLLGRRAMGDEETLQTHSAIL